MLVTSSLLPPAQLNKAVNKTSRKFYQYSAFSLLKMPMQVPVLSHLNVFSELCQNVREILLTALAPDHQQ